MKLRFWPRTLAVQLIVVTALAVALSNIAVAFWFEYGNERQNATAAYERVLDRAVSVATTITAVPATSRHTVMSTMSSRIWKFIEIEVPLRPLPMTPDEQQLARHLSDMLPAHLPYRNLISVKLHQPIEAFPASLVPPHSGPNNGAIQVIVPVDDRTMMSGIFVRAPAPWPLEMLVAAVVAILVTSTGAAFVAGRVVRPLSELTNAAAVVAAGTGTPHVMEEGPEDVRKAAIAFNAMTEKVTRTLESQRHLLSAVGHDLRTPLTAMRINLEFIEDDELRDGLLRNLDELQALTEQVLSAARGTGGETRRNVDLTALVESLCTDMDEIGEPVHWNGLVNPTPISCRPNEIRRAVRNLVENAVAYGHKADVRITDNGDGYDVLVEDEGPGIPENDRLRVFEPFVRLEGSRNATTGGTGLGLTLVKAIAEGHGGAVRLENRPEGGLRVRMHLPRMAGAA